jgi:single-strand DNA-binding protein
MAATRTRTPAKPAKTTEPEPPKRAETEYGERIDGSLSGNLTREPELRFTASGRAMATFGMAVNDRVLNEETQKWEDTEPEFYNVTVWGQQADHTAECFRRGDRMVAIGYFQSQTYTNQNGERVTSENEFTAREIGPSLLFRDAIIKRTARGQG